MFPILKTIARNHIRTMIKPTINRDAELLGQRVLFTLPRHSLRPATNQSNLFGHEQNNM